ncbi:MAG: alpha-L-fucosidase [bacterium]|nr:alpha-L-fucosidase [bacterium]
MILLSALCLSTARAETRYEPNWDSLDKRPIPEWYQDAKFGIFIHWGVYSVPSFAPKGQYAEWYWNHISKGSGESWDFHVKNFGPGFAYVQFAPMFKAEMFNPDYWADVFKDSGAKYVALTSKHHDGFCMFKSDIANRDWGRPWNSVDAGPHRDILGELGEAVRAKGLRMGFYYSLYEWYNPLWLTDKQVYIEQHMIPQFKDVVTRYNPSIIFSDGEWDLPSADWKSPELLAWLFNETKVKDEVVVNDRWGKETRHHHGDYYTTEYASGMADASHPWEENRGMGRSYGYNRNEDLADYNTGRELVLMLIDLVSRGGNLLLNIGPTSDGRIPVIMQQRLHEIGSWLKVNGEAIYGTRTWKEQRQWSEGEIPKVQYGGEYMVKYDINEVTGDSKDGKAVITGFFTKKDDVLYAITPRWPGKQYVFQNVTAAPDAKASMLGVEGELKWSQDGANVVIETPDLGPGQAPCDYAYTFKLSKVQP